ncbi:MAG: sodium:proton antiporter NhaD [Bacteroidetes bacterium]|nr:sodium:proton antiporter NhaD [Bacteroidota bacterium]MBP6639448.1 sodium:proton antiporter NhaD [Bacteroidia bacterium]
MEVAILIIFVAGYVAIAFEHSLMVSKAATALLTGVLAWTVYILSQSNPESTLHALEGQVAEIAQILFFLIGAMTIVELIDVHGGFDILTRAIRTKRKVSLLWIIALITFFLSAALDNLTTAIVMVSLIGKLIDSRKDRLLFAGIVIIAANSGGAWSPIGDVTTTMLWIKEKFTPIELMTNLFLPSLVSLVVPLFILSFWIKGRVEAPIAVETDDSIETQKNLAAWLKGHPGSNTESNKEAEVSQNQKLAVLVIGLVCLVFVPVFKLFTHLPPFMGMMLSLGAMWIFTEVMHKRKQDDFKEKFSPAHALERIDIPSMLFFLGILLAVGALQVSGILGELAVWLDTSLPNRNSVVVMIGLLSAIVDNVPLVSGAIQMYDPIHYPELATPNHPFWQFLAYCAGTGGSILIIGSAAGVAVMGIERVEFFWYVKRISWLALIGYLAGVGAFLLMA